MKATHYYSIKILNKEFINLDQLNYYELIKFFVKI